MQVLSQLLTLIAMMTMTTTMMKTMAKRKRRFSRRTPLKAMEATTTLKKQLGLTDKDLNLVISPLVPKKQTAAQYCPRCTITMLLLILYLFATLRVRDGKNGQRGLEALCGAYSFLHIVCARACACMCVCCRMVTIFHTIFSLWSVHRNRDERASAVLFSCFFKKKIET